jgi:hypothetical protein
VKRRISDVKPICLFAFYGNNAVVAVPSSETTEPFAVALFAGPFEKVSKLVGIDIPNRHLFAEGAAIEGRGVDVVVPHQVQLIDVFDGD